LPVFHAWRIELFWYSTAHRLMGRPPRLWPLALALRALRAAGLGARTEGFLHGASLLQMLQSPDEPAIDPPKRFLDVVEDMRRRWRNHKREQTEELEPWKAKKMYAERIMHRAERQREQDRQVEANAEAVKPQPPPTDPPAPAPAPAVSDDEASGLLSEAKKAKYGDKMIVVVRDPLGRDTPVQIRDNTPMRVLMNSVCKRLGLPKNGATFWRTDQQIQAEDTARALNMVDQDVLKVDAPALRTAKSEQDAQAAKEAHKTRLRAKEKAFATRLSYVKQQTKGRHEARLRMQRDKAEEVKRMQKNHMIRVRFKDSEGTEVAIGHSRDAVFSGVFERACKRLSIECKTMKFQREKTDEKIDPEDNARKIQMLDNEVVRIVSAEEEYMIAPMDP